MDLFILFCVQVFTASIGVTATTWSHATEVQCEVGLNLCDFITSDSPVNPQNSSLSQRLLLSRLHFEPRLQVAFPCCKSHEMCIMKQVEL